MADLAATSSEVGRLPPQAAVAPPAARKAAAHTVGLSQLTTSRYFVLLAMLHPAHLHEAVPPAKNVDARAGSEV